MKQLKEVLGKCWIESKWNNHGVWVSEKYTNLLELVEEEGIKITKVKKDDYYVYILKWTFGREMLRYNCILESVERALGTMLVQKNIYLGNKFKVETRFGKWSG